MPPKTVRAKPHRPPHGFSTRNTWKVAHWRFRGEYSRRNWKRWRGTSYFVATIKRFRFRSDAMLTSVTSNADATNKLDIIKRQIRTRASPGRSQNGCIERIHVRRPEHAHLCFCVQPYHAWKVPTEVEALGSVWISATIPLHYILTRHNIARIFTPPYPVSHCTCRMKVNSKPKSSTSPTTKTSWPAFPRQLRVHPKKRRCTYSSLRPLPRTFRENFRLQRRSADALARMKLWPWRQLKTMTMTCPPSWERSADAPVRAKKQNELHYDARWLPMPPQTRHVFFE